MSDISGGDCMKYNKVIFVCEDNTCQSPAAAAIMKSINRSEELEIESRGLVVLFAEPYNPKAASLLRTKGIILENGETAQLGVEDFGDDVLILALNKTVKGKLQDGFGDVPNVYTVTEFAGGNGEDIPDPYGADMETYVNFCNILEKWVRRAEDRLYAINIQ